MKSTVRTVLYSLRASKASFTHWYGEAATEAMLKVTDIIGPYMRIHAPFQKFFYQHNIVVSESETDVSVSRVGTNRIEGCPDFHQRHLQDFTVLNKANGFLDISLPLAVYDTLESSVLSDLEQIPQAKCLHSHAIILSRKVLASLQLWENQNKTIFGSEAVRMAGLIDAQIHAEVMYGVPAPYMRNYCAYIVREEYCNAEPYTGFVFTNLLYECPTFYPNAEGQRYLESVRETLNRNNGNSGITLPTDILAQVQDVADTYGTCMNCAS